MFTGAMPCSGWVGLRVLRMGKKVCESHCKIVLLRLSVCLCCVGMQEYDFLYKPGALDGPLPFVGKCAYAACLCVVLLK